MSFYLSKITINQKINLKEQNIYFLYLNVPHDLHGDQSEHPPALVQHDMILYPLKYTQKGYTKLNLRC